MFMFWSKRAVLTRRLLKAKVRGEHETECETQEDTLSRINVPKSTNNITQSQQQQQQQQEQQERNASTRIERNSSGNGSPAGGEGSRTTRAQKPRLASSSSPSSNSNSSSSSNASGASSSSSCLTPGNNRSSSNSVATRFHQGCCGGGGEVSHDEDDEETRHQDNNHNGHRSNVLPNRLTRCKELLKSLKEPQLEMLLNVVESYGADFGSCVLVPRKQTHQQHQPSPKRFTASLESPASIPNSLKEKEATSPTCNRHSRSCPLSPAASNLHEPPATATTSSSRRLNPHRHILRSRRHNPSTRCSRCPNNHPPNPASNDEFPSPSAPIRPTNHGDKEELAPFLSNDNQTNLRFIDRPNNLATIDDLRQQQPAWSADRRSNPGLDPLDKTDAPSLDLDDIDNDIAPSRPERDRCRNTKIPRSNLNRKRRESPSSGTAQHHRDHCNNDDSPPDDPHLLSCQTWRWPDLANSAELKKLPVCHSAKDPVYVCCNPYHWSRLCKPESPPPPYCLIPDRLRPEGGSEMGQREWCTLAYWELGGRVGRLYPVEPLTVNVFDSLHDGDGLCLATLAENHNASPAVQRTRSKIGLGLMLSQESDGVWAYNRSESPIFVNSPTLDDPESRTLLVYRVPPGFCLNIFDRSKTMKLPRCIGQSSSISGSFNSGPVDVNSVRISFAKGWGPKYSRQEVTSCPCWLEVLLAPCR
ncbi:uncharacterized protein DDB_G0283357-like isoform X2 [Venturia canescens]|uniref:uncharacterized protein DDB_G0283357-like isoform X2 n=1 Tax=Venturia canescens TaxID=32260 RepID=UPI001C9CA4C6|nr:uncharacterized protein DDB_G0283357-like isoform X2 [Venturia canescens]